MTGYPVVGLICAARWKLRRAFLSTFDQIRSKLIHFLYAEHLRQDYVMLQAPKRRFHVLNDDFASISLPTPNRQKKSNIIRIILDNTCFK